MAVSPSLTGAAKPAGSIEYARFPGRSKARGWGGQAPLKVGVDFAHPVSLERAMPPMITDCVPMEKLWSTTWHPDDDATPTPREVETMAEVLEGRHGFFAADVAEFFSTYHSLKGDAGRCWAWAGVAECVRHRSQLRDAQR